MNKFIKVPIYGVWRDVDGMLAELNAAGYETERGPICLSVGTIEYLNVILNGSGGVAGLIGIIVAYVKRGKKFSVTLEAGEVIKIDSTNASADELLKIYNDINKPIKEIHINDH